MAEYEMQESNLPNREGKRMLYPRIRLKGRYTLEEIARRISQGSTYSTGEIIGLVQSLTEEIAAGMAQGLAVKIDGLGIFTPTLGLRRGAGRETGEEGERRRNAQSIRVSGVHFRADTRLVGETGMRCRLERSERKFQKSSRRYTPEERLGLAKRFLATVCPFLTVGDYVELTGLRPTTAGRELRAWAALPDSGIRAEGLGSHRVYVSR